MSTATRRRSGANVRKENTWFRQTLVTSFVSIASVLVGVFGSGWLTERDKKQELDLAASRRAIESVESITSLIFERDARAELIASSIRRLAPVEELKERKKQYDEVYVRYNANLQSGLFNIRDRFHSINYNTFEDILMSSVQDLFVSEDRCITSAYDAAIRPPTPINQNQNATNASLDVLQSCSRSKNYETVTFDNIHSSILRCEYTFSDNLFKVVASPGGFEDMVTASKDEIANMCASPTIAHLSKQSSAKTASAN